MRHALTDDNPARPAPTIRGLEIDEAEVTHGAAPSVLVLVLSAYPDVTVGPVDWRLRAYSGEL